MNIKISDTGDNVLVTGPDEARVNAALQKLMLRGAQTLGVPYQVGSRWAASCTKPADFYSAPASLAVGEPYIPNQNIFEAVKLSDTGKQLIVSGKTKLAVQLALDELQKLGARKISSNGSQ